MKALAHRTWRFALVGAAGFVVDAGVLALMMPLAGPWWGRILSFAAAVLATWLLNRNFTFRDRQSGLSPWREFARYAAAMLGGGAVNYLVYGAIIANLGADDLRPYAAVALGSISGMAVNLLLARFAVFRHAVDS